MRINRRLFIILTLLTALGAVGGGIVLIFLFTLLAGHLPLDWVPSDWEIAIAATAVMYKMLTEMYRMLTELVLPEIWKEEE